MKPSPSLSPAAHTGKRILITGAGGYIGSGLTLALAAISPLVLVLLDNSEHNLYEIDLRMRERGDVPCAAILGDICDLPLIAETMDRFRPQLIIHAAACKHVPLMEKNPLAAIRTNALGTLRLLQSAARHGVTQFLLISTDKAVNPASVMGASKRIAEMALQRFASDLLVTQSIRLGNILGSHGSVGPLFRRQIARGGPVTVTHEAAERYFLSLAETVEIILAVTALDAGIFIPKLGPATKISELAERMIREVQTPDRNGADVAIAFTGLRAGDKLTEEFLRTSETPAPTSDQRLFRVCAPKIAEEKFDAAIRQLHDSVEQRNLVAALATLHELVPEYHPSEFLLEMRNATEVANT